MEKIVTVKARIDDPSGVVSESDVAFVLRDLMAEQGLVGEVKQVEVREAKTQGRLGNS